MRRIDTLSHRGIRASIRRGDILWLDPQYLVTPEVAETARSCRDEIMAEIRSSSAQDTKAVPEVVPDYHFLWVATDLDSFEEFDPRYGYELDCSPVYRMLDATYYAWLRHRMENAKKAHAAGRMDDETFEVLRARFNTIHTWAVTHVGEDSLRKAVRTTNTKSYVPPSESTYAAYRRTWDDAWSAFRGRVTPSRGDTCSGASADPPNGTGSGGNRKDTIPAEALAKVDAIRERAMALGWTESGLYGNSGQFPFPYGDGYGVARFVKSNCTIGEVTAEAIEIIQTHNRPDGTVTCTSLRHYNPDVRQPWRTISGQAASSTEAKSAFPAQVGVAGSIGGTL